MHHRVRSDWARDWNDAIHAKGCTNEHSLALSFYLVEILDDKHRKILHVYIYVCIYIRIWIVTRIMHLTIAALEIAADKVR